MYKAQRILIILFLLMIPFTFYGCNKTLQKNKKQNNLQTMLQGVKNYETDVTITFLKDEQQNILQMKQKVEIGGKYELHITDPKHLKGYITSFDGEDIKEYNPITKATTSSKDSAARNETMLSNFIERYTQGDKVEVGEVTLEDTQVTTLTMDIPGNYKYLVKQKVYFKQDTHQPIKMEIYDEEGNKTIQVEFSDFKYNTEIRWHT